MQESPRRQQPSLRTLLNWSPESSVRSPRVHPSFHLRKKVQIKPEEASLEIGTERRGEVDQDADQDQDPEDGGQVQESGGQGAAREVEVGGDHRGAGAEGEQGQGVGEGAAPSQETGETGKTTRKHSHHFIKKTLTVDLKKSLNCWVPQVKLPQVYSLDHFV